MTFEGKWERTSGENMDKMLEVLGMYSWYYSTVLSSISYRSQIICFPLLKVYIKIIKYMYMLM